MKGQKIFQLLSLVGAVLCAMSLFLYVYQQKRPLFDTAGLIAQNTYLGPIRPVPGNPELVKVEIIVRDSPKLGGVQVQSIEFDGESIPLKPRDVFGNRGKASFQVPPGRYTLKWVVRRDTVLWPRTLSREEVVTVSPKDLWVQISIEGEKSSIL